VEDQAGIALDLGDVVAVVMDAVAVEGQRRIAKQQHGIGHVAFAMHCDRRRRGFARRGRLRGRHVAINDILPPSRTAVPRGVAIRCSTETKHKTPVLPVFNVTSDMRDVRVNLIADAQWREEFQLAAGPHPARQRYRRQETAARGMAVRPQFGHREHRLRQAPMHGPRRRIARFRFADLLKQGGAQALHQLRSDDIGGLGAAGRSIAANDRDRVFRS